MSTTHGTYADKMKILQELAFVDIGYENRKKVREMIESIECVNLLDRDTGKEPILESGSSLARVSYTDGTGGFESRPFTDWVCPVCGWFVCELYSGHGRWHVQGECSYCSKCGQKIDWTLPHDEEKRRYEERRAKELEEWEKKNGTKLDNMHEGRRRKYGLLREEDNDGRMD